MIYLASRSPRRQELLRQIGVAFEVVPADIPEQQMASESPADYVKRVAHEKAAATSAIIRREGMPQRPVLAADTCVVLDDVILGKPENRRHGIQMLCRLAGRGHEVLTAVQVLHQGRCYAALSASRVTFGPLSAEQAGRYWESGEPRDKAGAYAIQGKAAAFVSHIDGSYSGVVGLPLYEVVALLGEIGLIDPGCGG